MTPSIPSVAELPFGGVGNSGTGAYHGKHGFDLFSHKKATMMKDQNLEFVNNIRYPPYTEKKINLVKTLLHKSLNKSNLPLIGYLLSLFVCYLFLPKSKRIGIHFFFFLSSFFLRVSVASATAAAIYMFMF